MSPSFAKCLLDLSQQFLWSALTLNNKYGEVNKCDKTDLEPSVQSTFYCYSDRSDSSVDCLSEQHIQPTNDQNCLSTTNFCSHYYTNCDQNFDIIVSNNSFDGKTLMGSHLMFGSNLERNGKCLSQPNLQINAKSCFSDSVAYKTIINDKKSDVKSVVRNEYNVNLKSVESTTLTSHVISNTSLDEEIPFSPVSPTNPYNRLLEQIDWFSSDDTKSDAISRDCKDVSDDEDFVTKINKIIATELCQNNSSTHLTNDYKKINLCSDGNRSSLIDSTYDKSCCLSTKNNENYSKLNQIIGEKSQNCFESEIQSNFVQNVILKDYFDNNCSNVCTEVNERVTSQLQQQPHQKLVNRLSLPSDPMFESIISVSNESNVTICSQNDGSRRLIVSDKTLKTSVLDRIKRIGRSQSEGRSDLSSMASNLNSRHFVLRTKGLYKNMKRRFSSVPPSQACFVKEPQPPPPPPPPPPPAKLIDSSINKFDVHSNQTPFSKIDYPLETNKVDSTEPTVVLRRASSYESIEDSGCGSSIQTSSLSTDSNRSSICTGDEFNSFYSNALLRGPFIGYAKAITDCTPCPYFRNALAFKQGDIISIISKDESGMWIGMNNGRVGHFKFVNVEEIKTSKKMNQHFRPNESIEEIDRTVDNHQNYDIKNKTCDSEFKQIFDVLKSRLVDCNRSQTPFTLKDLKQTIELTEIDFNLLSINGFNDLKQFSEIVNKDTIIDSGITDYRLQRTILLSARLLRDYYFCNNYNKTLINWETDCSETSQQPNKDEIQIEGLRCLSAPTTPVITPLLDLTSERLKNVSTLSVENNYICENRLHRLHSKLRSKSAFNKKSNQKPSETIYENNEQLINSTQELSKNSSLEGVAVMAVNKSSIDSLSLESDSKGDINQQNSIRIRDKSLDRNLLRKLDLKPIYMSSEQSGCASNDCSPKGKDTSRRLSISRSVIDLRTKSMANDSTNNLYIKSEIPLDRLRGKKRFKKLISSSKKYSSFESQSSLMCLANDRPNGRPNDYSNESNLCSKTLKDAIDYKLKSENIDLTEQPYSDLAGFCGIPPALIQRYTDECQRDTYEIAEALDELRMKALEKRGRRGIPNDYLGDSCVGPVIDVANYESLHLWLISLGLPMYEKCLKVNDFTNLYKVSKLREVDIVNKCGIRHRRHVRILTNAIGALHLSLGEIDSNL